MLPESRGPVLVEQGSLGGVTCLGGLLGFWRVELAFCTLPPFKSLLSLLLLCLHRVAGSDWENQGI